MKRISTELLIPIILYQQTIIDPQKLQYIHTSFKKEALYYYNLTLKNQISNSCIIMQSNARHFNPADLQESITNDLRNMIFQDFINIEETKKPKSL